MQTTGNKFNECAAMAGVGLLALATVASTVCFFVGLAMLACGHR